MLLLGVKDVKFSLKQLEMTKGEPFYFSQTLEIEKNLKQRDSEIIECSPVRIDGFLLFEGSSIIAQFDCTLDITLPSSRSLEPVIVKMSIPVVERYIPLSSNYQSISDDSLEVIIPLEDDWIDLQPAVEDHVLLSIPLRVLTPSEELEENMPSGTDWEVVSEERHRLKKQRQKEQSIDPRLAGLQSFFEKDETDESL